MTGNEAMSQQTQEVSYRGINGLRTGMHPAGVGMAMSQQETTGPGHGGARHSLGIHTGIIPLGLGRQIPGLGRTMAPGLGRGRRGTSHDFGPHRVGADLGDEQTVAMSQPWL